MNEDPPKLTPPLQETSSCKTINFMSLFFNSLFWSSRSLRPRKFYKFHVVDLTLSLDPLKKYILLGLGVKANWGTQYSIPNKLQGR